MSGDAFQDAEEELEGSLEHLIASETLRWIFVGGKGGVGKTTTACSLAVELASRRESVLLLSTDPAHNISDALCQQFGNSPTLVNGFSNLYAMEIDASFSESMEFKLKQGDGLSKVMQEFVSGFPGVDEAMGFAELMQNVQSMPYSVIVFDTAPTGHTLRLLGFPDLLDRGLFRLGGLQSKFGGLLQMLQATTDQEEDVMQRVTSLCSASSGVKKIFSDPTKCTFVCVCIPEFLSVYETERLIQELCKHGIDSSNIVVNQVLFPEDCGGDAAEAEAESAAGPDLETLAAQLQALPLTPEQTAPLVAMAGRAARRLRRLEKGWDMCQKKCRMQSKYLAQIQDLYAEDFHIVAMPMLGDEVRGLDRLQAFAAMLRMGGRCLPTVRK
uniref:ATPase ASNA1 homolog n=1 Tax=Alexandrium monilatum TaxID=311494 RepID=A0A7S4S7B2_9DINO|mmetsp:Transcript_27676/g.82607  ORF Transcript_27676/g.82607 Transcript_27676/m.82607 type:complete len:384 (+) Transcript_27676:39-1190(+)